MVLILLDKESHLFNWNFLWLMTRLFKASEALTAIAGRKMNLTKKVQGEHQQLVREHFKVLQFICLGRIPKSHSACLQTLQFKATMFQEKSVSIVNVHATLHAQVLGAIKIHKVQLLRANCCCYYVSERHLQSEHSAFDVREELKLWSFLVGPT